MSIDRASTASLTSDRLRTHATPRNAALSASFVSIVCFNFFNDVALKMANMEMQKLHLLMTDYILLRPLSNIYIPALVHFMRPIAYYASNQTFMRPMD